MSWIISSGTGVTLPWGPDKTRITGPAKVEVSNQEGALPILIIDGQDAFTLELQGSLYDCWDSVIVPLLGFKGKEVVLTTPEGDLDDTYILVSFEPSRSGALKRWTYSMKLQKGSAHVIL